MIQFDDVIEVIAVDAHDRWADLMDPEGVKRGKDGNRIQRFVNGKKYDKVSRYEALSEDGMHMLLDVNSELYPMRIGETFRMVLAHTLNLDASPGYKGQRKSLADKFEYVMHGLLYKIILDKPTKISKGPSKESSEKLSKDPSEEISKAASEEISKVTSAENSKAASDETTSEEISKATQEISKATLMEKSEGDVKVVIYVSFGGLQLRLKGELSKMGKFKVDQRLFLLLRKV